GVAGGLYSTPLHLRHEIMSKKIPARDIPHNATVSPLHSKNDSLPYNPKHERIPQMPDIHSRIDQFKKMAADDPNNELGHFSLGRAYLEAGIYDNAASAFERVIEINPNMSRAYQLLA